MKILILVSTVVLLAGGAIAQPGPKAAGKGTKAAAKIAMKNGKAQPVVERLRAMSPAERRVALSKMPVERRQRMEARLEQYDRMTEKQKKNVERFQQMPVAQQQQVRRVYQRFNELPVERRVTLRQEVNKITPMSEEARKSYLSSDAFRTKYNDQEQQMIHQLADSFSPEKE